ncbi:MAG: flagellar biosynthesis anti-sigma factor FlgM, partial [Sphingomonadales bacterium]
DKVTAPTPVSAASTSGPVATPSLVAALAEAGPPINAEKIRAIQQAIANGEYPIDAKAIAAKMIALDLPRATA